MLEGGTKTMLNKPKNTKRIICGAKTRSGHPCKTSPIKNRKRCRMHGCAKGSGAPLGSKNALKHGYYSKESKAARREANELIKRFKSFSAELGLL